VHLIDPLTSQIGESSKVLGSAQPLRLEAAHLVGRGGRPGDRSVADHPALAGSRHSRSASVLAGARIGQHLGTRIGETHSIV
jgi:hypothetical protein